MAGPKQGSDPGRCRGVAGPKQGSDPGRCRGVIRVDAGSGRSEAGELSGSMQGVAGPKQGSGRPAAHTIAGKWPSRCKSKVICWQRSAAVPTFTDASDRPKHKARRALEMPSPLRCGNEMPCNLGIAACRVVTGII